MTPLFYVYMLCVRVIVAAQERISMSALLLTLQSTYLCVEPDENPTEIGCNSTCKLQ